MQQFTTDPWTLAYQLLYYFPYYVGLVLVPMVIRVLIERSIGIRPEMFESRIVPLPINMSYETAFRTIVLTVLYYPLFEELVFRGLPFLLFGTIGLAVGSTVWVVMHPSWQLQYISELPLRKKLMFTATSSGYYIANAVFYGMMWVNGAGLAAILYHIFHNGWLTLGDIIKEVELPTPWKKYRYIRKRPAVAEESKAPSPRLFRLFRRNQKPKIEEKDAEHGEEEELGTPLELKFVVRKTKRSLVDEVEEARNLMFVKRKIKNE